MAEGKIQEETIHAPLRQMTDTAYAYATAGKAEILTWYQIPQGPLKVAFIEFYKHFELLYDLTYTHENVMMERELVAEVKKWLLLKHVDGNGGADPKDVFHGIDLFDMYRLTLIKAGVIKWT